MDVAGETPCLLRITEDGEQMIKTYSEFNSANPTNMNRLLREITGMYPSESYGLILWSHGTSWLPAGVQLKFFVADGNRQMNIPDLAEALPVHFDFILFDACLMGAVEVAYELRNKTDYIIASSTETIDTGFPYELVIPALMSSTPDLRKATESYLLYIAKQTVPEADADDIVQNVFLNLMKSPDWLAQCVLKSDHPDELRCIMWALAL
jgi:hypothetical protein